MISAIKNRALSDALDDLDPVACHRAILARDARFDGRFFTAVRSTGVYCRPICPARPPKPENCVYFPTAAAAQEAGYRPCLRCRPETAPETGAWRGTSSTVSRALALIEAGALDHGGVEALGQRLGVGSRQVRHLFAQHLGASPLAVAQTRRILLAKQLIHETGLTMTQVAFAAGFGSVRRFNETFVTMFGRPPGALRREARQCVSDGSIVTLSLSYRPPYDWDALLAFLAARAIPGVESVENGVYQRTIAISDARGWVAVEHQPERNRLRAAIHISRLSALPLVVAKLRQIFDLAADPEVIGAVLAQDPMLAPLVRKRPGLRVPGAWSGFELAVRAIVDEQIGEPAATRVIARIAQQHGQPIEAFGAAAGLTRLFPDPEALLLQSTAGIPVTTARAVSRMAARAVADPTLFDREGDLAAAMAKLLASTGLSECTAHHIAMRTMREPDAFPAAVFGPPPEGSRAATQGATDLLGRSEGWRPWRAYAALHLWTDGAHSARRSATAIAELVSAAA